MVTHTNVLQLISDLSRSFLNFQNELYWISNV